jgi:hypothetical protein
MLDPRSLKIRVIISHECIGDRQKGEGLGPEAVELEVTFPPLEMHLHICKASPQIFPPLRIFNSHPHPPPL